MTAAVRLVSTLAVGLSLTVPVRAQCQKAVLSAFDGDIQENYGRSTSIEDPFAVVGAPNHPIGVSSGAVYIYARSGAAWSLDQEIQSADNDPVDLFGASVSQSDARVIVGAPGDDGIGSNAGAAYVFRREANGWVQEQKLATTVVSPNILFGSSCAIDGDRAAIGAPGFPSGRVWIYSRTGTTWTEDVVLVPTFPGTEDFGRSVALEGDRLAVGAPGTTVSSIHDAGTVHLYQFNGTSWVPQQVIETPTPAAAGAFGHATAISGDRLAVGAFWENTSLGFSTGQAHVYREVGGVWTLEQSIAAPDLQDFDQFGRSIAIDGIHLVVGTLLGDGPATDSGTAYLYQHDGSSWARISKFWGSTTAMGDQFGVSADIRGLYLITGADLHDGAKGAAYVFGRCP